MQELGVDVSPLATDSAAWQAKGCTVSWLAELHDGREGPGGPDSPEAQPQLIGLLAFGDAPKANAAGAVAALQKMGVRSALITGDNRGSAQAVAQLVGISDVHADVLP